MLRLTDKLFMPLSISFQTLQRTTIITGLGNPGKQLPNEPIGFTKGRHNIAYRHSSFLAKKVKEIFLV